MFEFVWTGTRQGFAIAIKKIVVFLSAVEGNLVNVLKDVMETTCTLMGWAGLAAEVLVSPLWL